MDPLIEVAELAAMEDGASRGDVLRLVTAKACGWRPWASAPVCSRRRR